MTDALLSPELLRRLEQLQMLARRRSKSTAKGERKSRARGQSVEFADFRNYVAGDDLRYLDWNLYGRLDKLFVKLYEEERELPVSIFLDTSESMTFGTPSKLHFAKQVAAAAGHVALSGFDRVAVLPFPGAPEQVNIVGALRSVRGKKSSLVFMERLAALHGGGTTSFNEALTRAAMESRQTGTALVLSDFLDPAGYEQGLTSLLGRGFHVVAVQILAPEEMTPDSFGDLRLVDSETGNVQEVTFGKFRLAAYQQTVRNFCQRLHEFCQARGIRHFQTLSNASIEKLLLQQLRELEVWA